MISILKENKWSIVIIFIFSLPLLRFFSTVKKTYQKKLHSKTGFFLDFQCATIFLSKVNFKKIYLKTKQCSFLIEFPQITFSLKKVICNQKKQSITGFAASLVNIVFYQSKQSQKNIYKKEENSNEEFLWEEKIYPLLKKSINNLANYSYLKASVPELKILLQYKTSSLKLNASCFKNRKELMCSLKINFYNFIFSTEFNVDFDLGKKSMLINHSKESLLQRNNKIIAKIESYRTYITALSDTHFEMKGVIKNIYLNHETVSKDTSNVGRIDFEVPFCFSEEKFSIFNESHINFNGIEFSLNILHDCKEADLLRISMLLLLDGETFFHSYPFFIFKEFSNYKASGQVTIKLDYIASFFDCSMYYFKTSTITNTFELKNDHKSGFTFLNDNFVHKIKVSGPRVMRSIDLSSDNPDYLQLKDVPKILKKIVILTEDPNYKYHNGIDSHFVGVAIAKNIINKKIVKGASTITMQLARNIFLYHSKTVSRKLEEFLLAWLIENHFAISKERILEIYLNIIELGENIYGISEASHYYFDKKVKDLNITEYLVLSYVIPRPKYFLEAVINKSPKLIKNLTAHIKFYSKVLLDKKLIDEKEYNEIDYNIIFKPSIGSLELIFNDQES